LGMAYAEAFDVLRGARPARHPKFGGDALHPRTRSGESHAQPRRA
jgi:hypothetical protein